MSYCLIDFSRHNLTSVDVRLWLLKSIPALGNVLLLFGFHHFNKPAHSIVSIMYIHTRPPTLLFIQSSTPSNTRPWANVGSRLGQRRSRVLHNNLCKSLRHIAVLLWSHGYFNEIKYSRKLFITYQGVSKLFITYQWEYHHLGIKGWPLCKVADATL